MSGSIMDCVTLSNGVKMPIVGYGSVFIEDPDIISWAIQHGFRNIDTATDYGNENVVGTGVKNSGLDRKDVFITTKIWNSMHGYDKAMRAFEYSLKQLQTDYVDLYLIHWPCPSRNLYIDTWKAMEQLYKEGRIRAIGVSNFYKEWLERIKEECEIIPMVNQVEYNPYHQHVELRKYCTANNIQIEAYTPLARGLVNDDEKIQKIGKKYGKNCVQVTARFLFQDKVPFIPRSSKKERILSNMDIFDFDLTEEEMNVMRGLDENRIVWGEDPYKFDALVGLVPPPID